MSYKQKCKLFSGDMIKDGYCNGFFGRDSYQNDGSIVNRVLELDKYLVVELVDEFTIRNYAYFEKDTYTWEEVYYYLIKWTETDYGGVEL